MELAKAIDDYNNRPSQVLDGLTPLQALQHLTPDIASRTKQIRDARTARIEANRSDDCCLALKL